MFTTKKSRAIFSIIIAVTVLTFIPLYFGSVFGVDDVEPGLLSGLVATGIMWVTIFGCFIFGTICYSVFTWIQAGKKKDVQQRELG